MVAKSVVLVAFVSVVFPVNALTPEKVFESERSVLEAKVQVLVEKE
jgi:hypothetical protein